MAEEEEEEEERMERGKGISGWAVSILHVEVAEPHACMPRWLHLHHLSAAPPQGCR